MDKEIEIEKSLKEMKRTSIGTDVLITLFLCFIIVDIRNLQLRVNSIDSHVKLLLDLKKR